ncbi:asparaginase [Rhodococcus aerolatus]
MHHGSVVVLDADGRVDLALGEVAAPVFPRSSNKPMQAVSMLRDGYDPDGTEQLAIATASHEGEPAHQALAAAVLDRAGLTEDDLRCPPALPAADDARRAVLAAGGGPRRLAMNCSGKHAAMLATCVGRGWSTADYLDPAHPLQRGAAATVAELAGEAVGATGTDGCGAPIFGLSLTALARAFAALTTAAPGTPEARLADAARAHPFLLSGTGREDLRLMTSVPGLLCKAGAEGVHAGSLPDGRAFALKVDDGADRAREVTTAAVLQHLGVAWDDVLAAMLEQPLLGAGVPVGAVRPAAALR